MINIMASIIYRFNYHHLFESKYEQSIDRQVAATLLIIYIFLFIDNLFILSQAWILLSWQIRNLTQTKDTVRSGAKYYALLGSTYLSDALFVTATILLHLQANTFYISASLINHPIIATIFCLSLLLRSAQFPTLFWMFKLIDKPVSVSALMHAGVINLGGFMLLAYSPFLLAHFSVQIMCVATGLLSICMALKAQEKEYLYKHKLVYSTSLQMGFMFVEIGLGFTNIAFIHLCAHAFYKAGRFLLASSYPLITKYRQQTNAKLSSISQIAMIGLALLAPMVTNLELSVLTEFVTTTIFVAVLYLTAVNCKEHLKFLYSTTAMGLASYVFVLTLIQYGAVFPDNTMSLSLYYLVILTIIFYGNKESLLKTYRYRRQNSELLKPAFLEEALPYE